MRKVAIILSNINKALAFEWIADAMHGDFDLHFILLYNGTSELETYLRERKIKVYPLNYAGKKDLVNTIYAIRKILKKEKIELVHAHLLDAGLAGLPAARWAGIKKRIYTRHHATSHHIYHPHAVRYDRIINSLATVIVATSRNVKQVLMEREGVPEKKIRLIHHGFDLDSFSVRNDEKISRLKAKYNPDGKYPVIGIISRYIELKGIQYTIPAFKKLLEHYPHALLLLANASGKYKPAISALLNELPEGSFREIAFENDLVSLYHLFDVHVHVPVDEHSEAFGQTYVEALAAGVPSVFTHSGVAPELIRDKENALVVPYRNSGAIVHAMEEILKNNDIRSRIIRQGMTDVKAQFGVDRMISELKKLYES